MFSTHVVRTNHAEISHVFEPKSRHVVNMVTCIIYINKKQYNSKSQKITTYMLSPESDALVPRQQLKLNDDLLLRGHWGKRTRRDQRSSFNTSDN